MRVGDIVKIRNDISVHPQWPESEGQIGVIIAMAKRLHIPAAKVMVLGEIFEWDLDELEPVQ